MKQAPGGEGISRLFDHMAVTVSDIDRSLVFYRDLLGLREMERHLLKGENIEILMGKKGVVLQVVRLAGQEDDNVLIDLQQYVSPKGKVSGAKLGDTAHTHFGLRVKDLDSAYKRLSAKGVKFVSKPVVFKLDFGTVKVVFVQDPDGAIVELTETVLDKHKK
jgi:glyoxylase I family protein